MSNVKWDRYQQAVIDEVVNGSGHLVVQARAGSGKTSTIVEAVHRLERRGSMILCAFNKEIQLELERRAPYGCDVKTLHSVGMAAITRNWSNVKVNKSKGYSIAWKVIREEAKARSRGRDYIDDLGFYQAWLNKLVEMSKNALVTSVSDIIAIAYRANLHDKNVSAKAMADMAVKCLALANADHATIDFNDMVYFPAKYNLWPDPYDYVFVDEAQDLTPAQIDLVRKLCRAKGRIIAIGDPCQAMYSWRGADSGTMDRMTQELGAKTMPLSVTYRCPVSVVNHVKRTVPDLEPRPGAPEGQVKKVTIAEMLSPYGVRRGDFVLSRLNGPLAVICLQLLEHQIPAVIAGKDIGRGLIDLIDSTRARDVAELNMALEELLRAETDKVLRATDDAERAALEEGLASLADKIAAVQAVAEGETLVVAVVDTLNMMFSDDANAIDNENVVVLSTVHKAKGKERDRVWLLTGSFDFSLKQRNLREERNIYYVGATRARDSLFLVQPKSKS